MTDWNQYTRTYRANHPEKRKQWNINSAIKLLRANGYTVIEPAPASQDDSTGSKDGDQDDA